MCMLLVIIDIYKQWQNIFYVDHIISTIRIYFFFLLETQMMIKIKHLMQSKSDAIKIILYLVLMTTLFMSYCFNNNDEINKSISNFIQSYYNESNVSTSENGNTY